MIVETCALLSNIASSSFKSAFDLLSPRAGALCRVRLVVSAARRVQLCGSHPCSGSASTHVYLGFVVNLSLPFKSRMSPDLRLLALILLDIIFDARALRRGHAALYVLAVHVGPGELEIKAIYPAVSSFKPPCPFFLCSRYHRAGNAWLPKTAIPALILQFISCYFIKLDF